MEERSLKDKTATALPPDSHETVSLHHSHTLGVLRVSVFGALQRRILNKFSIGLHWFEVFLGAVCVIFVGYGVAWLFKELGHFDHQLKTMGMHSAFEELLSDVLLLVVGIELAIMLVRRTPESLVEVMFFVIARKMLIKTEDVYELLIGVVALAGLFAIRKYLEHPTNSIRQHHPRATNEDKPKSKKRVA